MTETELIGNHHARMVLEIDNQVESIAKTFRYAALIFLPVDFIYFWAACPFRLENIL